MCLLVNVKMISKLFLSQTRNSSTFVSLQEALKIKNVGKKLKIRGWIKAARVQKQNTFIDLDNGLSIGGQKVQVIVSSDLVSEELTYHSALQVEGILQASTHSGQEVELLAENIKMINGIRNVEYPFKPRARYNDEHPRSYPHFRANRAPYGLRALRENAIALLANACCLWHFDDTRTVPTV